MVSIETYRRDIVRRNVGGRTVRICTGSQASIKALEGLVTTSALVEVAKHNLNEVSQSNSIFIT